MELLGVGSSAFSSFDCLDLHDVDAGETGPVARGHIGIELLDGSGDGGVAEFLVHVVDSGSAVVANPDTVVLDRIDLGFGNSPNSQDFSSIPLHLLELRHEVPETTLGDDSVLGKNLHAENSWISILRSRCFGVRETASNNDVLLQLIFFKFICLVKKKSI